MGTTGPTGPRGNTGPTGPTGPVGQQGPRGTVANNFSQYLVKIIEPSQLNSNYTTIADDGPIAPWTLVYGTSENYYIVRLEIYCSPNTTPPELGFKLTTNAPIELLRVTSAGQGAIAPITGYSGNSNEVVLTFSGTANYLAHLAPGSQMIISVRWR